MIPTVKVNNINIKPFRSRKELLTEIEKDKKILVAINAEKILHADEELRDIINRNMGYADGIGAIMALHKKGFKQAIKIPGCELWLSLVSHFYKTKSFYIVGSKQETIERTIVKLKSEFPSINILGYRNGYIKTQHEREQLLIEIVDKKPDIVFVAMGSPKQELLMEEMLKKHKAIYQGLGGSFDVYTGNLKRAPKFWIKLKLEWFYRLLLEPTRIRRQIHLVRFFFLILFNKI